MKICYLTSHTSSQDGWGRYALNLIQGVQSAGHTVTILHENHDGFPGEPVLRRGPALIFSLLEARQYIKDCDIVHALDGYPYGVIAHFANRFCGKKLVITAQGTYAVAPLYSLKTKYFLSRAYHSADAIIAISRYTKSELLKKIKNKNVEVINHGIHSEVFEEDLVGKQVARDNFILSVGALKYRKGYHVSIPAFSLVKKKFPDLKYKIVGECKDARYFMKLKKVATKCAVENDIEFMSSISDEELGGLYRKARVFLLTSINRKHDFEGFGLVFLEAAAAGLPVVGTLGNGIEDAVKDGYNGSLVPQNDVKKTASAVVEIVKNEQKWNTMSKNGYDWAKKHDISWVVQEYIKIYCKILQ